MANVPEKRTSGKAKSSRNGDGYRSIKDATYVTYTPALTPYEPQ